MGLMMRGDLFAPISAIIQVHWGSLSRKNLRFSAQIQKMEADATKALLVAQGGNATKQEVRVAITKINRWKVVAIAQHAKPQIVERLLRTGEQLKSIIDSLVIQREQTRVTSKGEYNASITNAALDTPATLTGKGRLSHASSDLSTPEDIEEILLYYHDLFSASSEEATDSVLEPDVSEGGFWRSEGQDSVGVEFEMTFRRQGPERSAWLSRQPAFSFQQNPGTGWEGICGMVLSSLKKTMSPSLYGHIKLWVYMPFSGARCRKTFQSAALIGFFVDISFRHERGVDFPKILQETPYLGSHRLDKALPNLPYLFIVPPTLLDQWVGELKTCFKKGSVDLFVYQAQSRKAFWSEKGVSSRAYNR
ncbi:hypothetical protein PTI98_005664 [Pleurotus ostreatus]|nr:hypothetical protein PTI98_005664 [Pleurotus ostreatus]